jgi:hypothetical protein
VERAGHAAKCPGNPSSSVATRTYHRRTAGRLPLAYQDDPDAVVTALPSRCARSPAVRRV